MTDFRPLNVPCQVLVHAAAFLDQSPIVLEQSLHIYYMDWFQNSNWRGTVLTKYKNLSTPQKLRDIGHHLYKFPFIPNAGYHFSSMGGIERVMQKIASVVEGNVSIISDEELRNKTREEAIKRMRDGYFSGKMTPYDISKINLPYLNEFVKKYPYFLREYDFGKDDL